MIITAAIFENIQPFFYKLFVESVSEGNSSFLLEILLAYILVRLGTLFFNNFTYWIGDWFLLPAAADARMAVFKKIQDLDFAFHLKKSTGGLISAVKRGDNAFFDFHHSVNINLLRTALGFLIMLIFFSKINWQIFWAMIISFGANLVAARFLIRNNIRARREFNLSEDKVSEIIVDNLINFETVKLFAKETWELDRLKKTFAVWLKKFWAYANSFRLIDFTVGGVGNIGLFFVLLIGIRMVSNFTITAGDYVMILGFVNNFYPRFFELIYNFRNLAKNNVDLVNYFRVLDEEILVKDPIKAVRIKNTNGEIEFRNVSFRYPEGKQKAVKNINLIIRSGQSWAFVGHSGVGKTTLVKLLMRFYDPNEGQILLNGVDIRKIKKDKLRSLMGVVPQEPILFNESIKYNIAYGKPFAPEREIIGAAKMANLHDFIDSLPRKYETQVGERGVKLSGGQKQRLAIARMILSEPEIIIFDEATSQLDSDSELKIQDAFWKAARNKTTLIIAHRLSTVIKAEKIAVMKNGQIEEIGTHRELINRSNGLYRHFWELQSGKQTPRK